MLQPSSSLPQSPTRPLAAASHRSRFLHPLWSIQATTLHGDRARLAGTCGRSSVCADACAALLQPATRREWWTAEAADLQS